MRDLSGYTYMRELLQNEPCLHSNGLKIPEVCCYTMPGLASSSPTALGFSIPANDEHATSVSLPTWEDCTDYEKGSARVVNAMQIGYPRFFVNKLILKVSCPHI